MELSENDLKIYVVAHKKFDFKATPFYVPIQVNAQKNEHFLNVTDDTGDNISLKNDRFCELTALYWIWKNDLTSKYVGLCHYRRFFMFHGADLDRNQYQQIVTKVIPSDILVTSELVEELSKGFAIAPRKYTLYRYRRLHFLTRFIKETVRHQYIRCHRENDLEILQSVLLSKYPQYQAAWNRVMNAKYLHICNMFIMPKAMFDDYASWLFDILFEVEKQIPPITDTYQNRVFGFMAERLFNVYLVHNPVLTKEYPVLFVGDE